jgi:hypothetical protein
MPKTRPPYSPELRARLIELARAGRTREELCRQFEPSAQTSGTGSSVHCRDQVAREAWQQVSVLRYLAGQPIQWPNSS